MTEFTVQTTNTRARHNFARSQSGSRPGSNISNESALGFVGFEVVTSTGVAYFACAVILPAVDAARYQTGGDIACLEVCTETWGQGLPLDTLGRRRIPEITDTSVARKTDLIVLLADSASGLLTCQIRFC